jgi:site-specific DNA-methyltransferase (adenine-specific)
MEAASRIETDDYVRYFAPIWSDVTGAGTKVHPAPFPIEIAHRLILMFSFVGDTVLDPFLGSGTTTEGALCLGRNSIGVETELAYINLARKRLSALPFGVSRVIEE